MAEKDEKSADEAESIEEQPPEAAPDEVALSEAADNEIDQDVDDEPESGRRRSRILRVARRLMDTREITSDTKEIIGTVIGASDRAKTEAVKMAAREVRNYLDELKLKDDLLNLMTSYSLEVSISLKPLADAVKAAEAEDRRDEDEDEDEPIPDGETA